jgi:hypothetical protein
LNIYPNWSSSLVPEIFCRRSTAVWDINSTFNQERSKIKLIIEKPNLGIAVNNETIQLPGSGEKKKNTKSDNSDKLKRSQKPTQPHWQRHSKDRKAHNSLSALTILIEDISLTPTQNSHNHLFIYKVQIKMV